MGSMHIKMAAGHDLLSSMELAILLLMTTLFLHGNVNTSSFILRRDISAGMEHLSLVAAMETLLVYEIFSHFERHK